MKHQSAFLLSVLLVLGLTHVSASPVGRVLSRLRRTAGAGGSNASCLRFHYRQLHARTLDIVRLHRTLFTNFKNERYPNVSNPRVQDMVLSYLPTIRNFPRQEVRINLSDFELLDYHYINLIIFKDTLNRVEGTETGNITDALITVAEMLHEIIRRLETTIMQIGHEVSIVRSEHTTTTPFHTNVTTEEQNTRTLLVLQEFEGYIAEVLFDYKTLKSRNPACGN